MVTEALITLSAGDDTIPLPLLVGQRYEALLSAVRTDGRCDGVVTALQDFRRHDELRSFLCHGVSLVTLDRQGGWHARFTLVTLRRRKFDRQFLLVDDKEAMAIAADLRRSQQRLESKLNVVLPAVPEPAAGLRVGRLVGQNQ